MTRDQAGDIVAAVLAFSSHEHAQAAKENRNLTENAARALRRNRETCAALGVLSQYLAACSVLNVEAA